MRAYRPSYFAIGDAEDEQNQREKEDKMQLYRQRAEAGLPLFEIISAGVDPTHVESQVLFRK